MSTGVEKKKNGPISRGLKKLVLDLWECTSWTNSCIYKYF